jgi:secreted trypsin-like serine protease
VANDNERYKIGTVAGWGIVNVTTGAASDILLKVDLPIISNEDCEEVYQKRYAGLRVAKNKICTQSPEGKDGCKGDSGGPLMYSNSRYIVIGIVSTGASSCDSIIPAIYTRVASYVDWIEKTVEENVD